MKNKKANRDNESTVQEVNIVIPPDGGYAWIVVIAAFASNLIVDGTAFSFSIAILPYLSDELKLTTSTVAIIGSIQLGTYYLFGPFACAFINHYGFRAVGVLGCVIAFAGIFIASNIKSFVVIVALYGVMGGIGFGMIYTAGIISVGYYFEKYRALATGISVCGSSIGGLCLSPLFAYISDTRGWEYTMRLQSYFMFVCLFGSLAYRPLKPTTTVPLTEDIITEIDRVKAPSRVEFVELYKTSSMVSIDLDDHSEESRHFPQISIISSRFLQIPNIDKQKRKCCSCSWLLNLCPSKQTHGKRNVIKTGPLDRKDIFYSASVVHLPQYKLMKSEDSATNRRNMLSYHISMMLDPEKIRSSVSQTDNSTNRILSYHDNTRTCCGISHLIHKALGNLFDVSLLKSPVFCVLVMGCTCYALAWMTPYMYLPKRGAMSKIPTSYTNWFISYISIGNSIGRISAGVLVTLFPNINACYLAGCTTILGGSVTMMSAFIGTGDVNVQISYCVVFGFCIAFLTALRPIVFVNLLGLDKLTNAFGLSAAVIGIALLSGTPIASALLDQTGSLWWPFVLSGILFIASGVLIVLAFHIYQWQEWKNKE